MHITIHDKWELKRVGKSHHWHVIKNGVKVGEGHTTPKKFSTCYCDGEVIYQGKSVYSTEFLKMCQRRHHMRILPGNEFCLVKIPDTLGKEPILYHVYDKGAMIGSVEQCRSTGQTRFYVEGQLLKSTPQCSEQEMLKIFKSFPRKSSREWVTHLKQMCTQHSPAIYTIYKDGKEVGTIHRFYSGQVRFMQGHTIIYQANSVWTEDLLPLFKKHYRLEKPVYSIEYTTPHAGYVQRDGVRVADFANLGPLGTTEIYLEGRNIYRGSWKTDFEIQKEVEHALQ